jgi:uncharacterized protein YfiM (DUF2279 family)
MKASAVLAAALLATSAQAQSEIWGGQDKRLHFAGGALIATAVTVHTRDPWIGFAAGAGVGLVKELVDAGGLGTPSAKDFLVTVAGAAVGASVGHIIIAPNFIGYHAKF